ncbi:MAG: alpha/beta fold hydrolase [Archangium sp.]|nr:alpha/beta fold hydrolase [Archangium sp.]
MFAASETESLARDVVSDLSARGFDRVSKRFDSQMAAALPTPKLASVWDGVVTQFGAFKTIKSVRIEPKDAFQVALIAAQFEKSDLLITLSFNAQGQVAGMFFKPIAVAPAWMPPPYAGSQEEKDFTVGAKKLPGTLTLPKSGAGPFPVVVFVHGSGPNDRDESMGPNKLFKDLAFGLAGKGIATLRYDKRTLKFPGEFAATTPYTLREEVLDDVRDAVTALATTEKIDPRRIFVLGHSLGGTLGPRIAADNAKLAGLILFAGATREMDVLVREQVKVTAPGKPEVEAMVEAFSKAYRDPKLAKTDTIDFLGAKLPGSYALDLRATNPAKEAAALKLPVFVAQGGRDYQVTVVDFEAWKTALKGKKDVTAKLYPALNHHFLEGSGPATPAEYMTPGHVPLEVISDLSEFVLKKR